MVCRTLNDCLLWLFNSTVNIAILRSKQSIVSLYHLWFTIKGLQLTVVRVFWMKSLINCLNKNEKETLESQTKRSMVKNGKDLNGLVRATQIQWSFVSVKAIIFTFALYLYVRFYQFNDRRKSSVIDQLSFRGSLSSSLHYWGHLIIN